MFEAIARAGGIARPGRGCVCRSIVGTPAVLALYDSEGIICLAIVEAFAIGLVIVSHWRLDQQLQQHVESIDTHRLGCRRQCSEKSTATARAARPPLQLGW